MSTEEDDGPWDTATEHDDALAQQDSDAMAGEDPPTTRASLADRVRVRVAARKAASAATVTSVAAAAAKANAERPLASTLPPPSSPDRLPAHATGQPIAQAAPAPHAAPAPQPAQAPQPAPAPQPAQAPQPAHAPQPAAVARTPAAGVAAARSWVIVADNADSARVRKLCQANGLQIAVVGSVNEVDDAATIIVMGEPDLPVPDRVAHIVRPTLDDKLLLQLLQGLLGGRVVADPPVAAAGADPRVAELAQRIAAAPDRSTLAKLGTDAITTLTGSDRAQMIFLESADRGAAAGIIGWCTHTGHAVHASPAGEDARYLLDLDDPEGKPQSRLLVQPVIGADRRVHAVLVAARRWRNKDFTAAERVALTSLAARIAPTLEVPGATASADADERKPRSTMTGISPSRAGGDAAKQSAIVSTPRTPSDSRPPPVTARRPDSRPPSVARPDGSAHALAATQPAMPPARDSGELGATQPAMQVMSAAKAAEMTMTPSAGTPAPAAGMMITQRGVQPTPTAGTATAGPTSGSTTGQRGAQPTPASGAMTAQPAPASGAMTAQRGAERGAASGPMSAQRSDGEGVVAERSRAPSESGRHRTPSDAPRSKRRSQDGSDPVDIAVVATSEEDIARVRRIARKTRLEVSVVSRADEVPPYYRVITLGEAWTPATDARVAYAARATITDEHLLELLHGLSSDRAPVRFTAELPQTPAEAKWLQLAVTSARKLGAVEDLAQAERFMIGAVTALVDADRASCVYYTSEHGALWSAVRRKSGGDDRRAIAGIVGWAARTGRSVRVPRASADPRWLGPLDDADGDPNSQLLVQPVLAADRRVLAVLTAVRRPKRAPFADSDVLMLERYAALAGPLIQQLQLASAAHAMLHAAGAAEQDAADDKRAIESPVQALLRRAQVAPRWAYAAGGAAIMLLLARLVGC